MKTIRTIVTLGIAFTPLAIPSIAFSEETKEIEEIVVTSRRKDESVQDVPLSVTVFGEERISQLKPTTLRDFDGLAPNVYIGMNTAGPSASALYIRGIGYADIEKTQSPQVGVIVDGLQMGSSTGQLVDVFDVESIEVNRGPQGVLFGKNTMGGNIVVNRIKPQFNELGISVSAEAGNFESNIFKGRVNIPLINDTLALKIGMITRERDGYYDNITLGGSAGDVDFESQTLALAWSPTDNFDAVLTYDRIDDNSQIPPQDPRFNGDNPFVNEADKREPTEYEVDQVGLRIDWSFGNLTLHSITGIHDGHDLVSQDFDGSDLEGIAIPFAQLHTLRDQSFEIFTQEIRLDWDVSDNLALMFGVYLYDSELDFRQDTNNVLQVPLGFDALGLPCEIGGFRNNPILGNFVCQFPNARSTQLAGEDVESTSFFASMTWQASEKLEITLGVRAIDEDKDAFNSYYDYTDGTFDTGGPEQEFDFRLADPVNDCAAAPLCNPGSGYSAGDSWRDTIMTATATYAFTDSNRMYFSYAEGFRSGGFSIRNASGPSTASYEPETAWQFEVGTKNEFLDSSFRVNLAYFFIERENGQFSSIITLPPGSIPGTTTLINNGAVSETSGLELETQYIVNENLSLIFNAGIISVDNKSFTIGCEFVDGCGVNLSGDPEPDGTLRILGGSSDSRQPEWNSSFQIAYNKSVGPGTFFANVGYKKVGEFLLVNTGGGPDQDLFEGGYAQWDARVAYEWELSGGDRVTITAFGKNLSDEEFKEQALFLGGPTTGFQGWGAPRTYAVELRWDH